MKLLCTADIHIGRRSTKIPADLDGRRFSSAIAWNAIVDFALRARVDALLLAGDIVDHGNRYFEAYGPLEAGLKRLAAEKIHTVAVAGNHDHDVLFRLESYVGTEFFHLLGQNNRWETFTLQRDEMDIVRIVGWSFPSARFPTNPLPSFPSKHPGGVPIVGLMHADVGQTQSVYAPVLVDELQRLPVSAWVVGHVHASNWTRAAGKPSILLPGSPQALDPGEPGRHGPWLLHISPAGDVEAEHVPLSRVRYESLPVDLSDVHEEADWEPCVPQAIRQYISEHENELGEAELLLFRVLLQGRTRLHGRLPEWIRSLQNDFRIHQNQAEARIEQVHLETRPALDLALTARANDPPGILARLLLDLESDEHSSSFNLLHEAMERISQVFRHNAFSPIANEDEKPSIANARRTLIREGYLLLDSLLAQQEGKSR
ncbi:MAG TPA: DNA repair exonuclease [Candidatus Hydrogenedentes bacterium]|nr:DNA repair exonuclease [Candidatus Hydrogenedentota bacterium]